MSDSEKKLVLNNNVESMWLTIHFPYKGRGRRKKPITKIIPAK